MAERTGFEPATPGVTGRYSNQLNYRSVVLFFQDWWVLQGSNLRPTACKAVALPTELNTLTESRRRILPAAQEVSMHRPETLIGSVRQQADIASTIQPTRRATIAIWIICSGTVLLLSLSRSA